MRSIVLLVALAACGSSEIGEECDTSGSTDECVDDAVCTKEATQNTCRKLCDTQADCPTGTSCNGVSSSNLKSCQPD